METALLPLLADRFPDLVKRRGFGYFDRGVVEIARHEPGYVLGFVQGSSLYRVAVRWKGPSDSVTFICTCPAFEKFGPCKHLFAVLLAVDADDEADEKASSAPRPARTRSTQRAEPPSKQARPRPPEWARRIAEMRRAATGVSRAWSADQEPEQEIHYEIDIESIRAYGDLVIRTLHRQRRKNGDWGVLKELDPHREGAPPDSADARLLRRLAGASTPRELFSWGRERRGATFVLDAAFGLEILPLLAETGRLRWRSDDREGTEVRWDDGEPWRFAAVLDERHDELVLSGTLVRDDRERTLDEPVILAGAGFVVFPEAVARFDPGGAMPLVVQLRINGPLRAPAAEREAFERALAQLPGSLWRSLPWTADLAPASVTPQLFLDAPLGGRRRGAPVGCRVMFDYGERYVDPDDPLEVLEEEQGGWRRRDFEAERTAFEQLRQAGVRPAPLRDHAERHGSIGAGRVPQLVHTLMRQGWSVFADQVPLRRAGGTSASVRSGVDWFELEGGLRFDDQVAPFPELLEATRSGDGIVRLGDGSIGILPDDWLKGWGLLALGRTADDQVRFTMDQGWILDALLAEREDVATDAGFERYRQKLQRFDGVRPRKEPRTFRGALRDYQRLGLGWFRFLQELGLGGCLADDMGLGKTVQVLALLEGRRKAERAPSLVVAPRSVIFNWIDEAARFTPKLTVVDYTGPERRERWEASARADLIVTTYGTLRRDAVELSERELDYVVLDEAQAIKNPASQTAKAARLLRARHRLALSGTPIENHLGELWSLFEFLNPGMLGRSRAFQELLDDSRTGAGRVSVDSSDSGRTGGDAADGDAHDDDRGGGDAEANPNNGDSDGGNPDRGTANGGNPNGGNGGVGNAKGDNANGGDRAEATPTDDNANGDNANDGNATVGTANGGNPNGGNRTDAAPTDGDRLARAMRPFFLRRTKKEVLADLPEKTEQTILCDLGRTERRRYDELRRHYRSELLGRVDDVGLARTKMHVLEALLRLRQCACHPGLMAPDKRSESSAKLDALLPRLEEAAAEGHKALVFSQFTQFLGILRERLDRAGVPYEYLDGRTRKRKERVERFQSDPELPLFLISLKAGGHGLNLTAADYVFLLDPWWNPAVEAQAIDRAHRIGQTLPVFAYRLICRDTVEERVVELQTRKRELAASLFAGKGGALRDLTREDLEALLS